MVKHAEVIRDCNYQDYAGAHDYVSEVDSICQTERPKHKHIVEKGVVLLYSKR
jgi:hypothetical protein